MPEEGYKNLCIRTEAYQNFVEESKQHDKTHSEFLLELLQEVPGDEAAITLDPTNEREIESFEILYEHVTEANTNDDIPDDDVFITLMNHAGYREVRPRMQAADALPDELEADAEIVYH